MPYSLFLTTDFYILGVSVDEFVGQKSETLTAHFKDSIPY